MPSRRAVLQSSDLPSGALACAAMIGMQAPGFYRLRLGEFEITAISDGTAELPMSSIYRGIEAAEAGA